MFDAWVPRRIAVHGRLLVALGLSASLALVEVAAQGPGALVAGRNINMVSGTNFPDGDPFLQRQNEPSIAVSSRNPLHLLAAANDYRTVDLPDPAGPIPGDAWQGIFKSFDGGTTWKSTLLPGFPQDRSPEGLASPIHGLQAVADPTVRAGTSGLFYSAGIAFDRGTNLGNKNFVARFIDNNNKETGNSIAYLGTTVVDVSTPSKFIDKPYLVVDIPRGSRKGGPTCTIPGQAQPVPAGALYVIYSVFLDNTSGYDTHQPGSPAEGHTKILATRSLNCGASFESPTQVSERYSINQGATAAVDPNTGTLYVAWREFLSKKGPDSILVSRSTDGGKTFTAATRLSVIAPFDQGTTPTSFRTNVYPTIAVDAGNNGGSGRVYVAWSQRGVGPGGDARIVVSSSQDGSRWTTPAPADNPPARGHQLMPVLSFAAGKLQLLYLDLRDDVSGVWGDYIDEYPIVHYTGNAAQRPKRHTIDVRAAEAVPGDRPQFAPSVRVSQYLQGRRAGKNVIEQLQFNAPNLPLFKTGTVPFIGDYIDLGAAMFIPNPDGTWRYNTLPSDPSVRYAAWADNRDVRAPLNGDWTKYTPSTFIGSNGSSLFDPTQAVIQCTPGQEGMRNQNVYSARLTSGLIIGTLGNNKPLGLVDVKNPDGTTTKKLIQRAFVVFVSNPGVVKQSVVLHIASQPPGGQASFLQFKPLVDLPVDIAPKSTISREVYVTSTDRHASVLITLTGSTGGMLIGNVLLNPDITNPDITNPDITNPDITNPDIANAEAHALSVSNPDITNRIITNPDITNPDITNPDITNPDITNPDITNPDITNPDITNPDITNPDITNPDITNPDITNATLTDVTWKVTNKGNTATSYQVKLLLREAARQKLLTQGAKFQLVLRKLTAGPLASKCSAAPATQNVILANIINPSFVDPSNPQQFATVINPDITNPDITNATLPLGPGETGRVTLRVFNPHGHISGSASRWDAALEERMALAVFDRIPIHGPNASAEPAFQDPVDDLLSELGNVGVAGTSQSVDTTDADAGSTTPQIEASVPLIITTSLPDAVRTFGYGATIETTGGGDNAVRTVSITAGTLPPGLTMQMAPDNSGTALISGTPTALGTFTFTATVTCANCTPADAILSIRVFEPLAIQTASVPGVTVNEPYTTSIVASGGLQPYAWTLTAGSLPNGVTLGSSGTLTGTPTQSGSFTFTATVTDSAFPSVPVQTVSASLTLHVTPTADAQSVSTAEDASNAITLSGTGAPAASFTFNVSTPPAHGSLSGSGQIVTYTPATDYNGPDSFQFTVTQGSLTSPPATVSITVTPVNDTPVATAQGVTTAEETSTLIALGGTDVETAPANLSFAIAVQPTHGTLTGTPPNVTYLPAVNYSGPDSFTFTVTDRGDPDNCGAPVPGTCAAALTSMAATVTITVTAGNDPPVATAQSVTTNEDTNQAITLAGTDAETASANLSVAIATQPAHGTLSGTPPNVTYQPASNYNGLDSFTFTVTDRGDPDNCGAPGPGCSALLTSAPATVTITVTAVNDAPVANAQSVSTAEETPLAITLTGGDVENSALTFAIVAQPLHGTLSGTAPNVTYTPALDYNGPDSLTFKVNDGQLDSSVAAVSITVTGVNDAPVANAQSVTTAEDTGKAITLTATDIDGNPLTYSIVAQPLHGTLSGTPPNVTYLPALNYNGADSLTFKANDGQLESNVATVAITITAVNDAPVALPATVSTPQGVPIAIVLTGSDVESNPLTFRVTSNPPHGTISGTAPNVTYAPKSGWTGTDSFTFVANDGQLDSAAGTITVVTGTPPANSADVTVTLNDAPDPAPFGGSVTYTLVAHNNGPASATSVTTTFTYPAARFTLSSTNATQGSCAGTAPVTCSLGTLTNGASATVAIVLSPVGQGGTVPTSASISAAEFDYDTLSNSATQSTALDRAPVAANDSATTNEDAPVTISVLGNDSDPDGDPLTVTSVSTPGHGSAVINGGSTITYTPTLNVNGADSFTYTIGDGRNATATATVNVTVTAVNDAPVAVNDNASAVAGTPAVINVLANDFDVDTAAAGSVIASLPYLPAGLPANLGFPSEAVFASAANRVYIGTGRVVGALDPGTNTVTTSFPWPVLGAPSLSRANQTTGFLYFAQGPRITAVDARPASATFNRVAASLLFGANVQAIDLDETRGLLYVSYSASPANILQQSGIAAVDVNPANGTFHQVLYTVPLPGGLGARGIGVNPTTNRIYLATLGSSDGVYVLDGDTHALTKIPGTVGASTLAVNAAANLVFAGALTTSQNAAIEVVDPANSNAVTVIAIPALIANFTVNKRLAINTQTGRVYVRSEDPDVTHTGKVFVIDGDRMSPTFKQLVATISVGRDSAGDLVVDEATNRIITTSPNDLTTYVIDGATNNVTTFSATQAPRRVAVVPINATTHRAYVMGSISLVQVITLDGTPALTSTLAIGAEAEGVTVDTTLHRAYAERTSTDADVLVLNKDGQAGTVTGLPHHAGRYVSAVTDQATHRVYLLNDSANVNGTNSAFPSFVSIVDANTNAVVANLPVNTAGSFLGINPATHKVYVGGLSGPTLLSGARAWPGSMAVIDTNNGNTVTMADTSAFEPQAGLGAVVANTGTNKLYFRVNNSAIGVTAGVLDGATNVATPLPASLGNVFIIRVNGTLNRVYVGSGAIPLSQTGQLFVLDGSNHSTLATLTLGSPAPLSNTQNYIAVDESNGHVYVTDYTRNTVSVVDGTTNQVIATLPTGIGPRSVTVNSATQRVYVGNDDKSLTIIDGAGNPPTVVGVLSTSFSTSFIAVDPAEGRLYTSTGFLTDPGGMVIADNGGSPLAPLTINSVTQGAQGAVAINAGKMVSYSPTATASGVDTFTYTIADGQATSNAATVTVNVSAPLVVTPTNLPATAIGQAYDQTLTSTGGVGPYVFTLLTAGGVIFPGGLTLNAAGRIQGVPTASGNFFFTVQVTDSVGQTATGNFSILVGPFIVLTSSLPAATLNQLYSFTLTAGGSSATPFTWTLANGSGPMPLGLNLNSNGTITGTPVQTTCSSVTVIVQATDAANPANSATRSLTFNFSAPVHITTTGLTAVTLESFSTSVGSTCGSGTKTWSLNGALPLGVTFNTSTGQFSTSPGFGPRQNGDFPITIQVTDSSGSDSKNLTLRVFGVDQQPGSGPTSTIGTGSGFRIAQTLTVPAADTLTGVRFPGLTCSSPFASNQLTVTIEGVVAATGLPNDAQVLGQTTATINGANQLISLPPGLSFGTADRFAVVATSTGTCSMANAATIDQYPGGAAYSSSAASPTWVRSGNSIADYAVTAVYAANPPSGPVGPANLSVGAGTRVSQSFSTGATGLLAALRFSTLTCATNPLTVTIEGVKAASGAPDGNILAGPFDVTIFGTSQIIPLPSPLFFEADTRFAVVLSSAGACTITNSPMADNYLGGPAFTDTGAGWTSLAGSNIADLPANTLIQNPSLIYMTASRGQVRAVRLNDNRVLLVGPNGNADVFDPVTGIATATGAMTAQRNDASATQLTNGKVLVTGGSFFNNQTNSTAFNASAELYDPATNAWTATGSMAQGRSLHTATLLSDGRVLVSGGQGIISPNTFTSTLQSSEIYDAQGSAASAGPSMLTPRNDHRAALLADGRVLVTGGFGASSTISAEIYSPNSNAFAATGAMLAPRARHTVTKLADSTVLVAGGQTTTGPSAMAPNGERFNPAGNGTFTDAGPMVEPRQLQTATLLADNSVLLAGGVRNTGFLGARWAAAERFVPGTGFVGAPSGLVVRSNHGAALLSDGRVVLVGGIADSGGSRQSGQTIELYQPPNNANPSTGRPSVANPILPDGSTGSPYPTIVLAGTGGVGPYTFTIVSGALPAGVQFNAGTISDDPATPKAAGASFFAVRVTDSLGHFGDQTLQIRFDALDITTASLPNGATQKPYTATLQATGVGAKTWSLASGALPSGLVLNSNGTISGTPTTLQSLSFNVEAVDSLGQIAVRQLSINIQNPLVITTTSLNEGVLFEDVGPCPSANNGNGTRTWTIASGSLPLGVSLQTGGCFSGSPRAFGTFNFTVQVTDQSSPPQTDSKALTLNVTSAVDQNTGGDVNQPALNFGGSVRIGERVITGVTGTLKFVRLTNLTCPVGTNVTAEIQGLTAAGAPNGSTIASGSATTTNSTANFQQTITLASPTFFAADEPFALVFSATQSCQVRPQSFDSYPGDGYVSSSPWQRLRDTADGRYDIPFATLVAPGQGLGVLTASRGAHTSTILANGPAATNGKVLIVGGSSVQSAELYDPSSGASTAVGSLNVPRRDHTATLLDDGTVLITGGWSQPTNSPNMYWSSAEIYHPDSGTFELLPTGMSNPRWHHTATKLADGSGRVLIVGGESGSCCQTDLNTAEFYNPGSQTFTSAGTMSVARREHTATLVPDGRVVLAGGWGSGNSAQSVTIFDPATNSFTQVAQTMSTRSQHAAALAAGRVLLIGGAGDNGNALSTAVLFDPTSGTFASAGTMAGPRLYDTATTLPDGSVLVAGGQNDNNCCYPHPPQASLERYVPGAGWMNAGSLLAARDFHTASVVAGGKVLFTGTFGWSSLAGRSAELYNPAAAVTLTSLTLPQGYVGDPYPGAQLAATGGTPPYQFAQLSGTLPPGLSSSTISSSGSVPSGTPSAAGTFSFAVQVTDSSNPALHSTAQTLSIRINDVLAIATSSLQSGVVGRGYVQTVVATGGTGARHFSLSAGSVPPGLDLGTNGTIQGSPTSAGQFNFTVRVDDAAGHFDARALSIDVTVAVDESAWTTTFPYGGQIQQGGGITVDPTMANTVYSMIVFRGIHRSTDGGASWAAIGDFAPIQPPFGRNSWGALTMTPSGTLYFGPGGSVYRSLDKGATWSSGVNLTSCCVQQFVVSPSSSNVVYAATSSSGLFKTTDGGQNWIGVSNGLPASGSPGPYDSILSMAIDPASTNTLFLGTQNNGVFKSIDAGQNWLAVDTTFTLVPSATTIRRAAGIAINAADSNYLVVAGTASNNIDGVFASSNGGATWTRASINPGLCCTAGDLVVIDPGAARNADKIYVAQFGNVWRSIDGGSAWTLAPAASTHVVALAIDRANPQVLYAGTNGQGVFKSIDSGQTWTSATVGIRGNYFPHSFAHSLEVDRSNPARTYAGTQNKGFKSTDAGATWTNWNLPDFRASTIATHPSAPGVVYAFNNSLYKSTDYGVNWTKLGGPTFCCWNDGDLAIAPSNSQTLYFAAAGSTQAATGVYKSTDGGTNWDLLPTTGLTNAAIHALVIDPLDENVVYVGTQGAGRCCTSGVRGIFKTIDGGQTWTQLTNGIPAEIYPNRISIFHTLSEHVIYMGSETTNSGVYKSLDGGSTWTKVLNENVNSVVIDPVSSGTVYVGTWNTQGFYRTIDGGTNWTKYNEGLPLNPGIESIVIDPGNSHRIFLGTSAGVYVRTFP